MVIVVHVIINVNSICLMSSKIMIFDNLMFHFFKLDVTIDLDQLECWTSLNAEHEILRIRMVGCIARAGELPFTTTEV